MLRQQKKCYSKRRFFPIPKLHSILAVANLLAHNNISQIFTAVKFITVLQLTAVFVTPLGVTIVLLVIVPQY